MQQKRSKFYRLQQTTISVFRCIVTVEPKAARFPTSGGKSTFTVLNSGGDRLVFKVKCSNNKDYRIKPVYGFVDPEGSHLIWVVRLPAGAKNDKMVIQWTAATTDTVDAAAIFKTAKPTAVQSINVPLIGVAGDGLAEKPPEPKAAEAKAGEAKAGDAKPVEPKPAQGKAGEAKAGDAKPVEPKPAQGKAGEAKPAQGKADEAKSAAKTGANSLLRI
ncbi:unnamed protein product [Angiostrongylus costaricensis]|uniref:Major sperm protein n=1 Tax=Angiostrongylus costaricensis TaxID=334426 RepID=A0A0R3PB02_ANGCS|nr:unnamed protein product [Angiostrongylus costaricensis]